MITINEETKIFIKENIDTDINSLLLLKNIPKGVDLKMAVKQIESRKKAKEKLPELYKNEDFIFPPKLSMEQCSSQSTAQYKLLFIPEGGIIADMTGGFGIDTGYMARKASEVYYIEKNVELVEISRHNFSLPEKQNITIICDNSINYLKSSDIKFDLIYADPARRDNHNNKTVFFSDCEPNIPEAEDLIFSHTDRLLIKASPMLDITQAVKELKETVCEVHIVSVKNECKELLFLCGKGDHDLKICCVNILNEHAIDSFIFKISEERKAEPIRSESLQKYLYEPNASVMKSGAFNLTGRRFNMAKLHVNTHLYTSDTFHADFPGRIFEITDVFQPKKASFSRYISGKQANITVRNYPQTVDQLRKEFKIKEGGDIYLFAATAFDNKKLLIKTNKLR